MTPNSAAPTPAHLEQELVDRLDPARIPQHVAIIMDGNGRWAKQQGLPRIFGHQAGHHSVRKIVDASLEIGVRHLTLYAFSAENWRRPSSEVSALMELIGTVLRVELPDLKAQGVQIRPLGRVAGLPEFLQQDFHNAYEGTKENSRLHLNIAINYSGRWEIVDAARRLAEQVQRGELALDAVDEEHLAQALYMPDTPDPELLIRTSGEMRISNYLLWQIAYTELYVTPVLWPDFRKVHLLEAILDYQQRQRRFGAVDSAGN